MRIVYIELKSSNKLLKQAISTLAIISFYLWNMTSPSIFNLQFLFGIKFLFFSLTILV